MSIHLCIVYVYFQAKKAVLSGWDRNLRSLQSQKHLLSGPFTKKFTNTCMNI